MSAENVELTQIRYKPRARNETWMHTFLGEAQYGMVGSESGGQPFVTPTLFVYDETGRAI